MNQRRAKAIRAFATRGRSTKGFYRGCKRFYLKFKRMPTDADKQFIVNWINGDGYKRVL